MIKQTFGLYMLTKDLKAKPPFDLESFSKFKYGDGNVAKRYAFESAEFLIKFVLSNKKKYCLTGSAYHNTPTAATSIATSLYAILRSAAFDIVYTPLKGQPYAQDYSSMDFGQRATLVASNKLTISMDPVHKKEKRSLIVIDDIRVTGLHELAIENFLLNQNTEEVIFCYIVTLDGVGILKDPQLEWVINHNYVNQLDVLAQIVCKEDFKPNARICKFILNASKGELKGFLQKIPLEKLQILINLVEQDGYHLLDLYQVSYRAMKFYEQESKQLSMPKQALVV